MTWLSWNRYFSANEAATLARAASGSEKQKALLKYRTRKEALPFKARGEGLFLILRNFEVLESGTGPPRLYIQNNPQEIQKHWKLVDLTRFPPVTLPRWRSSPENCRVSCLCDGPPEIETQSRCTISISGFWRCGPKERPGISVR